MNCLLFIPQTAKTWTTLSPSAESSQPSPSNSKASPFYAGKVRPPLVTRFVEMTLLTRFSLTVFGQRADQRVFFPQETFSRSIPFFPQCEICTGALPPSSSTPLLLPLLFGPSTFPLSSTFCRLSLLAVSSPGFSLSISRPKHAG